MDAAGATPARGRRFVWRATPSGERPR
jgi:hypothetical protein